MLGTTLTIAAMALAPTLDDAVSTRLMDMSFTGKVVSASRTELRKINPDFAAGYEAEVVNLLWKEPMRLKLTTTYNGESAFYIINGDTKLYSLPRLGLRGKENISRAPGKHQTLLDFGLISASMRNSFLSGTYVRTDNTGSYVFDLRYQYTGDTSRHRIWVDPTRRYITKRMWYNQKGELMATFFYEEPVQVNGVWVPTRTTVKNSEDRTAGVTKFQNVKVNSGIADSNFKI